MGRKAKVNPDKQRGSFYPNRVAQSIPGDRTDPVLMNSASDEDLASYEKESEAIELNYKKPEIIDPETDHYNKVLFKEGVENTAHLDYLGTKLLVRMFKIPKKSSSGLVLMANPIVTINEDTGKRKMESVDDSDSLRNYSTKGVVIKLGLGTSEQIKSVVKVGDIIEIPLQIYASLSSYCTPIEIESFIRKDKSVDLNYFLLPESYIQAIWRA